MLHTNMMEEPETPAGVSTLHLEDLMYAFAQECHGYFLSEGATDDTNVVAHLLSSVEGTIVLVSNPTVQQNIGLRMLRSPNGNYWLAFHRFDYLTEPFKLWGSLLSVYSLQYHGFLASVLRASSTSDFPALRENAKTADKTPRWPDNFMVNIQTPVHALNVFEFDLEP